MQKRNLVWLASYPKSGNTWFRAFLSALLHETGEVDLNGLKANGIFSSREIFEAYTDLDSRYLYDYEVKELLPHVYSKLSNDAAENLYIKVHDAFTLNDLQQPIIPVAATKVAIYIIRNPLDVAASFANHMGKTINHSIKAMNSYKWSLSPQPNNLNVNPQLRQLILSWSGHVESWTSNLPFPVLVLRYEDMLANPFLFFSKAVSFLELDVTPEKIKIAIEATHFNKLQQKESESGFKEKQPKTKMFFRSGTAGNWKKELTKTQAESLVEHHQNVMQRYGYSVSLD